MNRPTKRTPAVSDFASPAPRTLLEVVDDCIERYPFRSVGPRRTDARRVFPPVLQCGEGGRSDGKAVDRPNFPPAEELKLDPKDTTFWEQVAEFLQTPNGQRLMASVFALVVLAIVFAFLFPWNVA